MTISYEPIIMPFDEVEIMRYLINKYHFSLKTLAKELEVSVRALYRFQSGKPMSGKVLAKLIMLYCREGSKAREIDDPSDKDVEPK